MNDKSCWTAFERYSISNGMPPKRDTPAWRLWVAAWEARVPEGKAVAPIEPTTDMVISGMKSVPGADVWDCPIMRNAYKAMIDAAQEVGDGQSDT